MKATPEPTRRVTMALTLTLADFSPFDPDVVTILDAGIVGITWMNLDEHVLLQLGEPGIGTGFVATTFVFDQSSGGQDNRVILGKSFAWIDL